MTSAHIADLLKHLGAPNGGALPRFSPGSEYPKRTDIGHAFAHPNAAVEREPGCSAWKLLGRALAEAGRTLR